MPVESWYHVLRGRSGGGLLSFAFAPIRRAAGRVGERYAEFSTRRPYAASLATAGVMLSQADILAQQMMMDVPKGTSWRERFERHDKQRTFAITTWGTLHYGLPQKAWYRTMDRVFGATGG